jgi:hypothetical protein
LALINPERLFDSAISLLTPVAAGQPGGVNPDTATDGLRP